MPKFLGLKVRVYLAFLNFIVERIIIDIFC
jgi:hypothetical protein